MTPYLITISLGPVQGLIAAARRTRDLWCGSWVLSEAARAAAWVLHQADPKAQPLIFPYTADPDHDLTPKDQPGDEANIANILRARITLSDAKAAAKLCADARKAATTRLHELGEQAKQRLGKLDKPLRRDVWETQIGDILECFSAWVPIEQDDYAAAGKRLGRLLNERKATRDFAQSQELKTTGLPKSSLDGARETVLPADWPLLHPARRKLGLGSGEQLDALGVIKRMAVGAEQFTPYARIAADAWIADLTETQRERIADAYEAIRDLDLATRCTGNDGIYAAMPYDGELLFDFRLQNAMNEHDWFPEGKERLRRLRDVLTAIARERDPTGQSIGAPVPYAAILKADGDHMGRLLSQARTVEQSRAISEALHRFASSVRGIVRDPHRGHAIYAGGDDVLAMVPLTSAQACARQLADQFSTIMQGVVREQRLDILDDEQPTLSVGMAIGHVMQPLGALRARAEQAEKLAKGDDQPFPRNTLAIQLGIRSGGEYRWRARWGDAKALDVLAQLRDGFANDRLPSRVAYDLGAIDRRLSWLRDADAAAPGMRGAEVIRMLDRARADGGSTPIPDALQQLLRAEAEAQGLGPLANTLIIARWLAARSAADVGED
jgi:CRISPR-associated protein Cmr2